MSFVFSSPILLANFTDHEISLVTIWLASLPLPIADQTTIPCHCSTIHLNINRSSMGWLNYLAREDLHHHTHLFTSTLSRKGRRSLVLSSRALRFLRSMVTWQLEFCSRYWSTSQSSEQVLRSLLTISRKDWVSCLSWDLYTRRTSFSKVFPRDLTHKKHEQTQKSGKLFLFHTGLLSLFCVYDFLISHVWNHCI